MADTKLIDLDGLETFYRKILTEDLAEYARYGSLDSSAIIAPTLVGRLYRITITNNDSRALTFYYGKEETLDKDDPDSFEGNIRIDAGATENFTTGDFGLYYVKAYADDGAQSPFYIVMVSKIHDGGSDD